MDLVSEQKPELIKDLKKEQGCSLAIGKRHIVTFMGFLFCSLLNGTRLSMAVALVAMVNQTQGTNSELNITSVSSCPMRGQSKEAENATQDSETGEFDWDSVQQSYVLDAGFLGYVFTQLLGCRLSELYGAKGTLVYGHLLIAFFTAASPVAARWHIDALVAVQFGRGMAQGILLSGSYAMMGKWIPRNERGLLTSLMMLGLSAGAFGFGALTGYLCSVPQLGWPAAFYVSSALTAVVAIAFQCLHSETPHSHPTISKEELEYITSGQEDDMSQKCPPTPWRQILTSVEVYALIIGLVTAFWSMTYFMSSHPTFLGTILHYSIAENGLVSSLSFLLIASGSVSASLFCDCLRKRNTCDTNLLRKGCATASGLGFCVSLVCVYLAGCDTTLNWVGFAVACFFAGTGCSGTIITAVDMTPRYAGSLMGLCSTVTSITAVVLPLMVGAMTKHATLEEWHSVFLVSIFIVGSSTIIFLIFGSAQVQPWNFIQQPDIINSSQIFSVSKRLKKQNSVINNWYGTYTRRTF